MIEPAGAVGRGQAVPLQLKRLEQQLERNRAGAVCAITLLLDLRDMKTGHHATRLAEWAVRVAEELELPEEELRDVEHAAMLHDIGKVGIPDAILLKPGPLTAEERVEVERHPEYGWAILRSIPSLERVALVVLHHHERVDGHGYPAGLKGDQIPLGSRIVSVVDAFDAMLSDRSYRRGLEIPEVVRRLRASSGTQFDSRIVDLFLRIASPQFDDLKKPAPEESFEVALGRAS